LDCDRVIKGNIHQKKKKEEEEAIPEKKLKPSKSL